jgi:hypothetical protein
MVREKLSGVACDHSYSLRLRYHLVRLLLSLADVDGDDRCGVDILFRRSC